MFLCFHSAYTLQVALSLYIAECQSVSKVIFAAIGTKRGYQGLSSHWTPVSTWVQSYPVHLDTNNSRGSNPPVTLGHLIFGPNWATLSNHHVDGYKCSKPSWQPFWPPHNQAYAHLNLDNSSLNKCPKPPWQAFWTPPQSSNYQFELQFSLHKCPKPSWQAFWPPTIKQIAHLVWGT